MDNSIIQISAVKLRGQLGEILEGARFEHKRFLVLRNDKPMAVLIGLPEYEEKCGKIEGINPGKQRKRTPQRSRQIQK